MFFLFGWAYTAPQVDISPDGTCLTFTGDGIITRNIAQSKGNSKSIQKVEIDGPGSLGERAFESFDALSSIQISDTLTDIGSFCFESCVSLLEFTFPCNIKIINKGLFHLCESLKMIRINSSVETIHTESIFRGCRCLELFYISLENKYFSTDDAHHFIMNKNGSILYSASAILDQKVPKSVKIINSDCYTNLTLNSIDFSTSEVEVIKKRAFLIIRIQSLIFPKTLKRVESIAFYQSRISTISLPAALEYFDDNALKEIWTINNLIVENSKALINQNGYIMNAQQTKIFFVDSSISNMEIPPIVTFIEMASVRQPTVLNVSVTSGNIAYSSNSGLLYSNDESILVACPGGKPEAILSPKCKVIETMAFRSCLIQRVQLNDGLKEIRPQAFMETKNLANVNFPSSLEKLDWFSFALTFSLEIDVVLGSNITLLNMDAFKSSGIRSIDLSQCEKLTVINSEAFFNCSLKSIKLPPLFQECGESLFLMSGIESIEFPPTTVLLSKRCMTDCRDLSHINISQTKIKLIPESCFESTSIRSIDIPPSVSEIAPRAFALCRNLERITFPPDSALTSISPYIIDGCESLEYFSIPSNVTSISDGAFANAYGLLNFIQSGPINIFCVNDGVLYMDNRRTLYAFPGGRVKADIDEGVQEIRVLSFAGCINLESIVFEGSTLRALGESTFLGCSSLKVVVLPGSLESFTSSTFDKCYSMESISFSGESNLSAIPPFCFKGFSNLSSFEFSNSIKSIGSSSFEGCAIESISLSNATEIGSRAFFCCSSIREVWISSEVLSIASDAFDGCAALSKLSYCGSEQHDDISFVNCSLSYVLVGSNYKGAKFGRLPALKLLDRDCLTASRVFTYSQGNVEINTVCLHNFIEDEDEGVREVNNFC